MRDWHEETGADERPVRRVSAGQLAREVARPTSWVTATVYVRGETRSGKAWMIWDGVSRAEVQDRRTGDMVDREKWLFLPKSQARRPEPSTDKGQPETIELPEWLARKQGLV